MFVGRLTNKGLSHQTIKAYLSAVRSMHVAAGFHEEFANQMALKTELILRGIKKEAAISIPSTTSSLAIYNRDHGLY